MDSDNAVVIPYRFQYIGKEPQEGKHDLRLVAKSKRRWDVILKAFNDERKEGEEAWGLQKSKNLRFII